MRSTISSFATRDPRGTYGALNMSFASQKSNESSHEFQVNRDLVDIRADDMRRGEATKQSKRVCYQVTIFMFAFFINLTNCLQNRFITVLNSTNKTIQLVEAVNISKAVGFLILGNFYDNVKSPLTLTVVLIVFNCVLSLLVALMANDMDFFEGDINIQMISGFLQMQQLLSTGLTISAIIILHNWIGQKYLGVALSFWFISNPIADLITHLTLEPNLNDFAILCFIQFSIYFIIAWLAPFFYLHNPVDQFIAIEGSMSSSGFFMFKGGQLYMTQVAPVRRQISIAGALKFKVIIIVILCFTLQRLHDTILATDKIQDIVSDTYYISKIPQYFFSGAIIGILLTGILSDSILRQKRLLTIIITSVAMLVYDLISIFIPVQQFKGDETGPIIALILGAVMYSNSFAYIVFIPVIIARNLNSKLQLNIPGTVFGVILASVEIMNQFINEGISFLVIKVEQPNVEIGIMMAALALSTAILPCSKIGVFKK